MNKFLNQKYFKFSLLSIIFILGVCLRLWKYPFYPFVGHAEEYLYVWSGLSLIEKGVPISWNDLPAYKEENVYWRGVAPNNGPSQGGLGVRLLKPWLDEPPLFSLMVGGIAKLYSMPNFTVISSYVIRIPSLIISFISMLFVFLLARKLFGYWQGIFSLLIYSIIPTVVFGSRLAVPENLIALLMIACLYLMISYLDSKKKWQRNLAIILAGLAGLTKPTGYLLVFFITFFLLEKKRWKEAFLTFIISSLIFFIPFLAYGNYFDWQLFKEVIRIQGTRPAGWSSLSFILTNPGFSIEVFLDGMIILGMISLFYLIFKKQTGKGERIILFSLIFALLVTMISGGKHDQLTWYRYPLYPFMAISISLMIKEIFFDPSFFLSAIFVPLAFSNVDILENPFWKLNYLIQSTPYRIVFFLLLLPSILKLFFKNKFFDILAKLVIIVSVFFLIGVNIWVIESRFNILCDNEHCPLPEKINLLKPFYNR